MSQIIHGGDSRFADPENDRLARVQHRVRIELNYSESSPSDTQAKSRGDRAGSGRALRMLLSSHCARVPGSGLV